MSTCFDGGTHPELDQEESMGGAAIIQLPQTALLLREFVIDLPDIHTLERGCSRAGAVLADVYKQVPLVLGRVGRGLEVGDGLDPWPHCPSQSLTRHHPQSSC